MDQNWKFLPWWRRKYCFSESFLEVGFDYQYWLRDWKMAADKPVHHHSRLVGAKLILLTLLDTILYGNNQFRDVSTFSLHTTSPIRTIIKSLQHQNNNDTTFRVKSIHVIYMLLNFILCTIKTDKTKYFRLQMTYKVNLRELLETRHQHETRQTWDPKDVDWYS